MSDPPTVPPVHIEGTGHNITFGQNLVRGDQTTASSSFVQNFYSKHLASHGLKYWLVHLLIAFLAIVIWEGGCYLKSRVHFSPTQTTSNTN